MKIHEFQAKEILRRYGVATPRGRVADFRQAMILMTSNLGALVPSGTSLGFGSGSRHFQPQAVLDAIEKNFRRELINRIDRIVVMRPLNRDTMRDILRKEIEDAFRRRGLRNRGWAVVYGRLAAAIDTEAKPQDGKLRPKDRMEDPGLFVFSTCRDGFLRTVPEIQSDSKDPDDVDTDAEDHVADEVRYRVTAPKPVVHRSGASNLPV